LKRLSRPGFLLALALSAATITGAWHFSSKHSDSLLSVPEPQDLDRLDPQLRAYLREKIIWVRAKPRDVNRQSTLGLVYAANGLWEPARVAFQNAARLDPSQPLARMYAAIATEELGELNEAIGLYRDLTVRFPDYAPEFYRLGDASLRGGDLAQAEPAFRRLIVLAPKEWRGYAGLGDLHIRRGQYADAAKELQKAVQLAPDEKIAHHLLGLAYRGLGRIEDAEIELSRGLNARHFPMLDAWADTASEHMKLLPDLFDMAKQYSEIGKPQKAVEILKEALAFHPDHTSVMQHLADAFNQSGQPQKARELLLKVVQKEAQNLPACIALSHSCVALREFEEALIYASRAVELETNSALAYLAKANVFLAMERDEPALSALESAFRCDPRNAQIQMTMGDVCLQNLDRPNEAMEHYRMAVKLDPALLSGFIRIAQLNIERGQAEDARKTIEIVRKLSPANPALALLEEHLSKLEPKKDARD